MGVVLNIFLLLFALAATCGVVWADERSPNYVRISTGLYQPTGDLDDGGYDSGFNISGVYGRYFGKYLVLEGGIGYAYSERDFDGSTTAAGFYIEEDSVSILSVTATAKGVYPAGKLEIFGGAGIDGHFVRFDADIKTRRLGKFSTDDEDTLFGFHIVGGANYNITERLFLGGEIKYLWTDEVDISKPISDIPIGLRGDLNGYTVSIIFGFRF